MTAEQGPSKSELPSKTERLKPGCKLLLPSPDFLAAFAYANKENKRVVSTMKPNEKTLYALFEEYDAIYSLLAQLVRKENIFVTKTKFLIGKNGGDILFTEEVRLPQKLLDKYRPIGAHFLTSDQYKCYPRDAHTFVDGKILANKNAWSISEDIVRSGLGEGGRVLTRGKVIFITRDINRNFKDETARLRQSGFRIGVLPFVDPREQKHDFKEDHIDGHATLIEGQSGKLSLIVADSYSRQGNHTRRMIREACEFVGVKMVEVDDSNLPPLALNLIQFEDRSIAMTNSEAYDLELTLVNMLGRDKVFTTDVPLVKIPHLTCAGIRCLTNIIPPLPFIK
ncbi:MAG: hypothetical protein HY424_00685 [Candidatus Levybacteria bacterium]|nr:hypothetical protein [Candidatus Levybacteria bacterium]